MQLSRRSCPGIVRLTGHELAARRHSRLSRCKLTPSRECGTAPLLIAGVPVELPNTSAARISQPKKPVIVSLAADGSLYIREEQVTHDTLVPKLTALRSTEGDMVVYVRADKSRAYGEVMEILGRVGESGYPRVSLLSQPKANGGSASQGQ